MTDWDRIRAHYKRHEAAIKAAGASAWGIDAYAWDHNADIRLTPIEAWLWSDIRAIGAVLYPQYPVGRRFVDFGNPVAKVAIECDGAKFHQDKEADAKRQGEIEALGWTVYRLTGRECRTDDAGIAYQRIAGIAEAHGLKHD
jgi:very-short-patch-repair endonuclease